MLYQSPVVFTRYTPDYGMTQWRNNRVDKVDNVHGPPSARGPRVPDQKKLYLATQSKFDVINYSYSVSTPVDVDTAYT